jgi:tripartite-type tricarboxylate transporter receptor subunit TctC
MKRRTICTAMGAATLTSLSPSWAPAHAAAPTRLLVPSGAGGFGDRIARTLSGLWASSGRGRLIVVNRPGAGGALAVRELSAARADGSVMLLGSTGTSIVLPMTKAGSALQSPTPVVQIASIPGVLLASTELPKDLDLLVAYAQAQRGRLSFCSAGHGSLGHLALEALNSMWGVEFQHVAYKSGPEAVPDLLAGRVHLGILNLGDAARLVASGRTRAVAVSGNRRWQVFPDVPTFDEAGIGAADIELWQGLFLPPSASPQLVRRLADQVGGLCSSPAFAQQLVALSATPSMRSPEQFEKKLRTQSQRAAGLVLQRGIDLG